MKALLKKSTEDMNWGGEDYDVLALNPISKALTDCYLPQWSPSQLKTMLLKRMGTVKQMYLSLKATCEDNSHVIKSITLQCGLLDDVERMYYDYVDWNAVTECLAEYFRSIGYCDIRCTNDRDIINFLRRLEQDVPLANEYFTIIDETSSMKENKYDYINRANSWASAVKKGAMGANGLCIKYGSNKTIFSSVSKAFDSDIEEKERGSFVVFPTTANVMEHAIVDWFKQKTSDNVSNRLVGWAMGRYLNGRYKDKDGNIFSEESLSIMLVGISVDALINIAENLSEQFAHTALLVKDFSSDGILSVKC